MHPKVYPQAATHPTFRVHSADPPRGQSVGLGRQPCSDAQTVSALSPGRRCGYVARVAYIDLDELPGRPARLVLTIEPVFLTRPEAAEFLRLSTAEVDRLRAIGALIPRRYGRRVLFPLDELRRFAMSLPADDLGA
ncbi:helix-turn-helix DNA binding protein [Mycobacterium phage Hammy]|uniref:Helix-turn-helix DNA binding protein n=1 Tax=Mycobacterium phage DarthP TaxID=2015879 RepID=A0A286MRB2_9CAUD|nr:HTH DNA binding protein [Mycobacterium phage DarthP]APD18258.1 helix-turn-helix DNA binding protein [Mycobacterium phage Hammy]ASW31787.1 helix-turn-helix DNA binding protein [Mycobacterium phage DarthP]